MDERLLKKVRSSVRLAAVTQTRLLDAPTSEGFDRLTRLARTLLRVPTALVTLVDSDRQFFVSANGVGEPWASRRETPLSHSFCKHVVGDTAALVVTDARSDARVIGNGAIADLGVVAYAGVPLIDRDEQVLGAVCAIDSQPREWTTEEIAVLHELARLTMTEIELRKTSASLLESERLFRSIFESAGLGIVLADLELRPFRVNPALQRILGYSEREIIEGTVGDITHPDEGYVPIEVRRKVVNGELPSFTQEKRYRRKDGEWTWVRLIVSVVRDESERPKFSVSIVEDISEAKRLDEALRKQTEEVRALSLNDELTTLHNRRGFVTLGTQQLLLDQRSGWWVTLFFIDLDGMKTINDELGHDFGDAALRDTATLLRATFRQSDVIARLGGDEFAVLAANVDADCATSLKARLLDAVKVHNANAERKYRLALSIGFTARASGEKSDLQAMLASADAAMYAEKRTHKGRRAD